MRLPNTNVCTMGKFMKSLLPLHFYAFEHLRFRCNIWVICLRRLGVVVGQWLNKRLTQGLSTTSLAVSDHSAVEMFVRNDLGRSVSGYLMLVLYLHNKSWKPIFLTPGLNSCSYSWNVKNSACWRIPTILQSVQNWITSLADNYHNFFLPLYYDQIRKFNTSGGVQSRVACLAGPSWSAEDGRVYRFQRWNLGKKDLLELRNCYPFLGNSRYRFKVIRWHSKVNIGRRT